MTQAQVTACDGCGKSHEDKDDERAGMPPIGWWGGSIHGPSPRLVSPDERRRGARTKTQHRVHVDACSLACLRRALVGRVDGLTELAKPERKAARK